ncbi:MULTISPECIES: M16 family metallopeptidase [unclassified Corallococcus]|uniref:M16 family metallopeptidase n=1 Tax=unclassified Corallococcus TaxID=2685029 RepID=UPI001A8EE7BD|nr:MULTISPECIES: pitrilysin family protein [unclassified Corallococcus]MBN9685458.1 insulinase family protein [Corallococcus sp. NCSPR001]WAS83094.1 pitrilysin family protein [Corallococcus sp. NCRR]
MASRKIANVKSTVRKAAKAVRKQATAARKKVAQAKKAVPAQAKKLKKLVKAAPQPKSAATGELKLPALHESTTSTGLRVIAAERGPLPLVSVRLVMRAGGVWDPAGKDGLADFTARLLRRGTKRMDADGISEAIEFVGASLYAGVNEDVLSVYLTTPAEHFSAMLDVLGQVVREPTFPEKEVVDARERALAQFANDLDDPSSIADRAFTRAIWGDHPYGRDLGGNKRTVSTFTRDDVVRFHAECMGPRISLLTVVGAIDPATVAAEAERAFAGWTGGPDADPMLPRKQEPLAKAGTVLLVDKPDQTQSQVRLGGPGFWLGHEDYFPATAMNIALGGGFTSRLMNEIRVNRGLTYGVSSYFDTMSAAGIFALSTFTKTASTREIIDVALKEIHGVRDGGLKPRELKDAQSYLAGLYPLRTETNESVASVIADMRMHGLGDDWVEKFRDRLRAVTPKDVAAAAKKYAFADRPVIVVLGKASEVKPLLEGLGPITVVPASDYE